MSKVRDRYLCMELKLKGPYMSITPSDKVKLTAVMEMAGKDAFIFVKEEVSGLELGDGVIVTGAPSLEPSRLCSLEGLP